MLMSWRTMTMGESRFHQFLEAIWWAMSSAEGGSPNSRRFIQRDVCGKSGTFLLGPRQRFDGIIRRLRSARVFDCRLSFP